MCTISIYNPIGCDKESLEALQIAVLVRHLRKNAGLTINLMDFEDSPEAFCHDQKVEEILLQEGPDVFPVTVVDGEVFQKKGYPCYQDLLAWSANRPLAEITPAEA